MSRIEQLERRVQQDPASVAFGALAEEYRRSGRIDDAIAACRAGLVRHPSYVSARVTLGRALVELGQVDEARDEFSRVLTLAPDNLAAIRGLADLHAMDGGSQQVETGGWDLPADVTGTAALEAAEEPQAGGSDPTMAALDATLEALEAANYATAPRATPPHVTPAPNPSQSPASPLYRSLRDLVGIDRSVAPVGPDDPERLRARLAAWLSRLEWAREAEQNHPR